MAEEGEEPLPDHTHRLSADGGVDEVDEVREAVGVEEDEVSVVSDDSFHSTMELMVNSPPLGAHNQLYLTARELVTRGGVKCRTMRWV